MLVIVVSFCQRYYPPFETSYIPKEKFLKKPSMLHVWKSLKYAKKLIYQKTRKKQSEKKIQKRISFLYKNYKLLKYCTFIHQYHDFSHGFTDEFELEPLASQAFFQRRALAYCHNHGQHIHPSYIRQVAISY